jgi:hypothetical protein
MPQNPESSIPLDEDDILDLTEVADPGKGSDGPPEPGSGGGLDFGADLDALLDSLAPDGTVSAPSAPSAGIAAPESPVAAPIKDQTPVPHQVDPNEEMAMPETSDIDSLLAKIGADIPADTFTPLAEEVPVPKAEPAAAPKVAPIADFDNLLAQAQAAEAQKAAEEATAPVVAPPFPAVEEAPAAPAMEPAAGPALEADDAESLDLNELDALLDDILATAPEMSAPAQNAAPAPVAEISEPVEVLVSSVPSILATSRVPEDDGLPDVIPVPEVALMPNDMPDSSLDARIRRLEDAVDVLETEVNNQLSENIVDALIDAKIAALLAPGSEVVAKIVAQVVAELTAPGAEGENAAEFREKLEKMAAAAAARVIREEIAALMRE